MTFIPRLVVLLAALLSLCVSAATPPLPNILWITAEDISPNLGCYGDPDAVTPNLDKFATEGVRFQNCFSVHPCCSPSRSALATGVYPTRLGTFQHRSKMWVNPDLVKCFPTLLRNAGYYTFNGSSGGTAKLDYNFEPKDRPWDKVNSKAVEWNNRTNGQPFFGQINLNCTHQSQYGQRSPDGEVILRAKKKKGRATAPRVHSPAKIHVPAYHPDTPAVRAIWADYHDRITQMDSEFGALLKMLAADGLADNTIVFFFGDNGHGVPGGKVWLWEPGPHVPLIVRFPESWSRLAPSQPGSASQRLVSFIDFAPTMLSLAGVPAPEYMTGTAFLGSQPGKPRQYLFAARDFHDGADFDTSRMVRDERYHYIRNFMPHQGWDAIQYSWKQAPHMLNEWREAAAAGKLQNATRQAAFFRQSKPVEELYETTSDPAQLRNVSADPAHQAALRRLRGECERWMLDNHDLGLLSQYELYVRSEKDSPYQMAIDHSRNPVPQLLAAANLANRRDPASASQLHALLKSPDGSIRRWGAIGLLALGKKADAESIRALTAALKDPAPDVRLTAAEALFNLGQGAEAESTLVELLSHASRIIRNETLLAICRIGPPAKSVLPHLDKALGPSQHEGIWSYDNIPDMVALAQSCVSGDDSDPRRLTRQKYLP